MMWPNFSSRSWESGPERSGKEVHVGFIILIVKQRIKLLEKSEVRLDKEMNHKHNVAVSLLIPPLTFPFLKH